MPSLSTFFESLTKEQDKLIQMGVLKYSEGKDHALMVQGIKNVKSKEKQIVKEKNPKYEIEDEVLEPSDEDSMKKVKNKGSTSKCSYCSKGFNLENIFFKNNMDIISQLLEKHNIEVPDELEKPPDSSEYCHSTQFQGDINYASSSIFK